MIPANQADFSADGMLCSQCEVDGQVKASLKLDPKLTGHALDVAAEKTVRLALARRHLVIGIIGLVVGIPLALAMSWSVMYGSITVVSGLPILIILGGATELGIGLAGRAAANRLH